MSTEIVNVREYLLENVRKDTSDYKKKLSRFGYDEGDYTIRCRCCGSWDHTATKRSVSCFPCASVLADTLPVTLDASSWSC